MERTKFVQITRKRSIFADRYMGISLFIHGNVSVNVELEQTKSSNTIAETIIVTEFSSVESYSEV